MGHFPRKHTTGGGGGWMQQCSPPSPALGGPAHKNGTNENEDPQILWSPVTQQPPLGQEGLTRGY